jgi:multidrug efflux pump
MRLIETSIARPVATSLLMLGLCLAGLAAFLNLPAAPVPQIDYPVISISASIPGASPEPMASSVATPLERRRGPICRPACATTQPSARQIPRKCLSSSSR